MAGKRVFEVVIAGNGAQAQAAMAGVSGAAASMSGSVSSSGARAASASSSAAATIAGAFAAFTAAAAVAVGAVGVALENIGAQFDDAFDTIRIGTGETGQALADTTAAFEGTFRDIPVGMGDAATAVEDLRVRLGLSGETLESVAENSLNLARLLGEDTAGAAELAADVFNNWGVSAEDMVPTLDKMLRTSQQTGIGFGELAGQLTGAGLQLREMGFSVDESMALLGNLEKVGLSSSDVMAGMNKVMAEAAEQGRPAKDVFNDLFDTIKGAPDDAAAAAAATEMLGGRAGPRFASLIREGKLSWEDLTASLQEGDTIAGLAEETDDWRESFELLKNRAFLALEPIATRVFDALGRGFDWVTGVVDRLSAAFDEGGWEGFLGEWDQIATEIRDAAGPVLAAVGDMLGAVGEWIVTTGAPFLGERMKHLASAFWGWIQTDAIPWLQIMIPKMWDVYVDWVTGTAWPWLAANVPNWLVALWGWIITDAVPWLWNALGHVSLALHDWFYTSFVPWLVSNWPQWRDAFVGWVTNEAIPWLIIKLAELKLAIENWVTGTAIPWLQEQAPMWAAALVDWVRNTAIPAVREQLGEWLGQVVSWAAGLPGQLMESMLGVGRSLVSGLWAGIQERWGDFLADVRGLVDQLPQAVRDLLGISSPSKVMMQLGEFTMEGFAMGVQRVAPSVEVAAYAASQRATVGASAAAASRGAGSRFAPASEGVHIYLDGRELDATVTRRQRRTARAAR